jgi:ATP phosphoribosyltransferase regulatory subunit HisZ
MANSPFSPEAMFAAYQMAAHSNNQSIVEFAQGSQIFDYAVTPLGPGLSMDVECDTGLPVSTPAEKREALFQRKLLESQRKANKIARKNQSLQKKAAKEQTKALKRSQKK